MTPVESDAGIAATALMLAVFFIIVVVLVALLLLPYIIARHRGHAYRNIILVLCVFGFTGVAWVVALIWAIYPKEKSLIDPVFGNPIGTGPRNVGDTIGSVQHGRERSHAQEQASVLKFCSQCGTAKVNGENFCSACGTAR